MFSSFWQKRNRRRLKDETFAYLFEARDSEEIVIFDTETTGLNPKKDEILSIGAVKVKGNRILTSEIFECFLKTEKKITKESVEIHGIRPCDLDNAIDPKDGIGAFLEFIGSRPLVGYYLEFDVAMINSYIKPWLGIKLPNHQIEVSGIYFDKKIERIPQAHIDLRFETILKELKVPNMGQHNAVNDAIMTAMIYLKLQHTTRL